MTDLIAPPDIFQLFRTHAEEHPEAPCILTEDGSWSYWHVASQANALAVGLHHLGIEPGDRVAVHLPNWPEFIVTALASAELGAILVPLNPGTSYRELQFMLRNSEAAVVVTAETWEGTDYLQVFESLLAELPDLQYAVTVGEEDLWYDDRIFQFEDLVSSGRGREFPAPSVDPDEDAYAILYTAGTDGSPKGVLLTHANLSLTALKTARALGLARDDRTLCCVPLYHIFGLSAAMLTALATGSSLVLQDAFDPAGALDLAARHDVTILHGVPTMFVMMLREAEERGRTGGSVRTGIIAGAPVRETLVRDLRETLVPDLEIAYGLTETSPTVSITSPEDGEAARSQTVGRPLEGIELKVVDEDGEVLPPESVGQLLVRGFNVMKGYFRQPGQTRNVMTDDGFLRTG
ncbi:MAG: class I adenylate-forming enzyme family protein, partial [Gemmatimonadota bacterium]|nr:class I adenylate-forming enzyme family protein [Gemmatimonadota bacterium]